MKEETGITGVVMGDPVGRREFVMQMPDGEQVLAEERFFVGRIGDQTVSRDQWTALEVELMAEHKWWTAAELKSTSDTVWPSDLVAMLKAAGVAADGGRQRKQQDALQRMADNARKLGLDY